MADENTTNDEGAVVVAAEPTATPATDPAKDPTQERVQAFIDEYGELVKKHEIDFASYPVFVPDGTGGFKVVVQNTPVDIKNQPRKSPFVAQ